MRHFPFALMQNWVLFEFCATWTFMPIISFYNAYFLGVFFITKIELFFHIARELL